MELGIVVDSVADLPDEIIREYDFTLVHFPVYFGEKTYLDKLNLTSEEFFALLKDKKDFPRTAAPSPGSYQEAFRKILEKGKKVLAFTITSRHSAAYQSAIMAKKMLGNEDVEVIDSGSASMGIGLLAIKAAEMIRKKMNKEEILSRIRDILPHVQVLAMLPTIAYAAKGGRISAPVAKLASLLNIKPMIRIRRGIIEMVSRVSDYKGAISKFISKIKADLGNRLLRVAVMHAGVLEEALELKARLEEIPHEGEIPIAEIGPALGTHSGPGTIAVAFFPE
ncbi:MAG: DegV family protein [Caldiserica bacterium]|jgi:DegV family protein with EDD domain|nr:DegV family protein [Caldisericota bacterium]MDH7562551.1 DegV family protein [Caldisericota bacterium]